MLLKKLSIFRLFMVFVFLNFFGVHVVSAVSSIITSIPIISNISGAFSAKEEIELEEVMLSIDEDMNNKGAVKLHIVIIFEKELFGEIRKLSAREYFRCVDQLVKDHPDKMKVFAWELEAKKRIIPWAKIQYDKSFLQVCGAIIFANYSTIGEHRAIVPEACKKMKIELKKTTFHVKQADQSFLETQVSAIPTN